MVDMNFEGLSEDAKRWLKKMKFVKEDIIDQLSKPEVQNRWKTNATSDAAEEAYKNGVERAVRKRKRQKNLQKVNPADWGEKVVTGLTEWEPNIDDARNVEKGKPIRDLMRQIKAILAQVPDADARMDIIRDVVRRIRGLTQDEIAQLTPQILQEVRTKAQARMKVITR